MMSGSVPISSAIFAGFLHGVGHAGLRQVEPDLEHGVLEQEPVLALLDGLRLGADHAHAVLLEDAARCSAMAVFSAVWPPSVGQEGVGLLLDDDLLDDLRSDRLDVGPVGELRIGHDRGRIGVDQDHA